MQNQTLAQRKRAALQRELTAIAVDLFTRNGYEQTTVEVIAEAAGMSRRTFFRYYASKEDVVIGKWQAMGDDIVARFLERPREEPLTTAMRAALDVVTEHYADPVQQEASLAFDRIIAASPQLSMRLLYQVSLIELRLTEEASKRQPEISAVQHRAQIGAINACLRAAMFGALPQQPEKLGVVLDDLMRQVLVRPAWQSEQQG